MKRRSIFITRILRETRNRVENGRRRNSTFKIVVEILDEFKVYYLDLPVSYLLVF